MTIQISRTDLARNTRKAIEQARRNGPVMVESYGEEQVAIMDAIDYRLLRAAAGYHSREDAPINNAEALPAGLSAEAVEDFVSENEGCPQARWDRVMSAYLDADISLGRAAVLLGISRFELQDRLNTLGLPIHLGPRTVEEARREYEALKE